MKTNESKTAKVTKGCRECGNLAVGPKGLCWKCEEQKREFARNRDWGGRGPYHVHGLA